MNIVVFGSSGTIGHALIEELSRAHPDAIVYAVARHQKIGMVQKPAILVPNHNTYFYHLVA